MLAKLLGSKSRTRSKSNTRTFKVVNAVNTNGCVTKFRHGRYTGNPQGAARKAFTKLCNLKNIRGKCTLYITVQETTQGSGKVATKDDNNSNIKKGRVVKKQKSYLVERVKLAKPLVMFPGTDNEFKRLYATKSKSVSKIPTCEVKRSRTRGAMKRISRRTNKERKQRSKRRASGVKGSLNNNLGNNSNYKGNKKGGRKSLRR